VYEFYIIIMLSTVMQLTMNIKPVKQFVKDFLQKHCDFTI